MRCLAICQDELVIKVLDEILLPSFEIEFLVDSRPLARRLSEAGVHIMFGDLRRKDTFLKATAAILELPDYFGENLDALADSLHDIDCGEHGMVLLWDGWSPLARHDEKAFRKVRRILDKRAESDKRGKLAVIMRGEGPELEVEELPIKH